MSARKPCPRCAAPIRLQGSMCGACYAVERARPDSYVTRPCDKCDKPFVRHKSLAERGHGRYCSTACARSGSPSRKKMRPVLTCATCKTAFEKFKSELAKTVGASSFCSSACWYEHNQKENHYGWAGGQHERLNPEMRAWRVAVLARDKRVCRLCHEVDRLEVHHILPFGAFPQLRAVLWNGITLCRDCHTGLRHRELDYFPALAAIAGVPLVVYEIEALA